MNRFWLMILADFFVLAVIAVVILLAAAAWQYAWSAETRKGCETCLEAFIRYVAELVGVDTDSERAIRWLILLMVLCCDPLAMALTAAASVWRGQP